MAEGVSDVTGIELGIGYTVYTRATIDQTNIRQEALAAMKKWRQDALADARIKFIYNGTNYTIPEYLKANGMSVEEYLNPSWSNTMERIAIQRVIEWSDTRPVNRRPNGELWYRAGLNGINTNGEVFAQGQAISALQSIISVAASLRSLMGRALAMSQKSTSTMYSS